jgi:hypothetical protein
MHALLRAVHGGVRAVRQYGPQICRGLKIIANHNLLYIANNQ